MPERGRPKAAINLNELEMLAQLGATNAELAAHFRVSERTIDARLKEPEFAEARERGEATGKLSLRRKQMSQALSGDRTLLIWLGKQRLGQSDKLKAEHTGKDGEALAVQVVFVPSPASK